MDRKMIQEAFPFAASSVTDGIMLAAVGLRAAVEAYGSHQPESNTVEFSASRILTFLQHPIISLRRKGKCGDIAL